MKELDPQIREILDTVIYDLRFGGTSSRRLRRLVASETPASRADIAQAAITYLNKSKLAPDDPLVGAVVVAIVKGLVSAPPSNAPVQHAMSQGRDQKGRELRRLPQGLRVEYDGMVGEIHSGWLHLADGQRFETVSPAARHVTGQASVNGWVAWRVIDDGRQLGKYYDQEIARR